MDPATIASASVAASKALYSISTSLYTYIHSAKQVDKSLQRLHDEVQSLERVLKAVGTLLERPAFSEHSAAAEMMQGMWSPIRHAVSDTQITVLVSRNKSRDPTRPRVRSKKPGSR